MNVSKSNLAAILLEVGEENAAVLLARSHLPEEIDLPGDLDFLTGLGLDRDQVDEVAQLTIGSIESDEVNGQRQRGEMETTISRRWADLVDQWLAPARWVTERHSTFLLRDEPESNMLRIGSACSTC